MPQQIATTKTRLKIIIKARFFWEINNSKASKIINYQSDKV
jgi:hypothetical protein